MNPNRRQFLAQAAALGGSVIAGNQLAAAETKVPEIPLAPEDRQPPKLGVPEPARKKVGWAIVGLGQLALEEIMPAFAQCRISTPVALVSGHPDKAQQVAYTYGIPLDAIYSYENYDALAKNDRVQAIYIVLPNSMHAEYTVRGLRAGKHVLCEKPMSVSLHEAEWMISEARDTDKKLMIAYRLHYEPMNRRVMDLCARKEYGEIKTFESSNCQNVQAPNIRLSGTLGGGPLGDVGIYSINAARYVTGEEPVEVFGFASQPTNDPRFREVPESVTFTLRFPSGVLAHCDCSFGSAESRRYRVHCVKGFIEMDPAFSYRGLRLRVKRGDPKEGTAENAELAIDAVNHFAAEMDHFSECILNDTQCRTPGEMGLADLKVISAIQEAIKTGKAVKV